MIEIQKDVKVLVPGQKVGASEADLLAKMNIMPFSYGMDIRDVYDDETVLEKSIIEFDPSTLIDIFQSGVNKINAISLETGYVVKSAVPHMIMQAIMKALNMRPYGGGVVVDSRAGVQLNTKAYIEPSNEATMMQSVATRQLEHTTPTALFRDVVMDATPELWSPWFSSQRRQMRGAVPTRRRSERSKGAVLP